MYIDTIAIVMLVGGWGGSAFLLWKRESDKNSELSWELGELKREMRHLRENSK